MPIGLAVGLGGALGALARFYTVVALRRVDAYFPWGTLLVNVLGSLLIGIVWGWCLARPDTPEWVRVGLMTGLLGGFTTMSSVSLESVLLFESHAWPVALGNVVANVGLGLLAAVAGLWLARQFFAA